MPVNGFSMTVADMFSYPFSSRIWFEARSDESAMSSYIMTYVVATDTFRISNFEGEQFKKWGDNFCFTIHTRTYTVFEQSSYQGVIVVPGDVIRSAIKGDFACYINKQTPEEPDTHPLMSRFEIYPSKDR